jgi:dolichyl-phosphate-mannose-protein mannosyltransferase
MMFWFGFMAIMMTLYEAIIERNKKLGFIILGYLAFLLPWALSPRIMFLYHYSPCIPFMSLALGYQLSKFTSTKDDRIFLGLILMIIFFCFLFIYPFLTGIPLEKDQVELFFKTNITKNPFGE